MFIQLSNQNAFDIRTSAIVYDLFIDEMPCGHGTLNKTITIEAGQIKRISLPLWIPYSQLDKVSKSVLQNKLTSPKYELKGEIIITENDKEKKQKFVIRNYWFNFLPQSHKDAKFLATNNFFVCFAGKKYSWLSTRLVAK